MLADYTYTGLGMGVVFPELQDPSVPPSTKQQIIQQAYKDSRFLAAQATLNNSLNGDATAKQAAAQGYADVMVSLGLQPSNSAMQVVGLSVQGRDLGWQTITQNPNPSQTTTTANTGQGQPTGGAGPQTQTSSSTGIFGDLSSLPWGYIAAGAAVLWFMSSGRR